MKMKSIYGAAFMAAVINHTSIVASANPSTTSGFGTIPGAPANAYGGSGIPIDTSEWTQIAGLPGSDTLTLGLAATQHGSSNPAPGNDGAGTFTVNPGLVSGRSVWNWDFYVGDADSNLGAYTYGLTVLNVGNGQTYTFNPVISIGDNVGAPASAGNSESFDFAAFGTPISYNASLNDTYDFSLTAYLNGNAVGSDSIAVIAGTGAVAAPDVSSTAGLTAAGFAGLIIMRTRGKRGNRVLALDSCSGGY